MRIFISICIVLLCLRCFSQSFVPDTAVNRIALSDSTSVLSILGKDCWNFVFEDTDHVKVIIFNKKKTEKLELIFHEGGVLNEFSEFKIFQVNKISNSSKYKSITLNVEHFQSAKGIMLGLSPKSVESKLGIELERKQSRNGEVVLFFRKEIDNDPAFRKYNMPVYYGEYIFRNDQLITFSFGFEQL